MSFFAKDWPSYPGVSTWRSPSDCRRLVVRLDGSRGLGVN